MSWGELSCKFSGFPGGCPHGPTMVTCNTSCSHYVAKEVSNPDSVKRSIARHIDVDGIPTTGFFYDVDKTNAVFNIYDRDIQTLRKRLELMACEIADLEDDSRGADKRIAELEVDNQTLAIDVFVQNQRPQWIARITEQAETITRLQKFIDRSIQVMSFSQFHGVGGKETRTAWVYERAALLEEWMKRPNEIDAVLTGKAQQEKT